MSQPARYTIEVRDNRGGDWFWAHNILFESYSERLGVGPTACYLLLCKMADKDTQSCFPSLRYIATKLKCTEDTARKYLKELVLMNMVEREERYHEETGGRTSDLIILLHPRDWLGNDKDSPTKKRKVPRR